MGCDGGTIPRRDELVKTKKKAEAKDKNAQLAFQWLCCAISQQILCAPIVMCHLGRLYSKLSVLEALLNRDTNPTVVEHIRNMKDIRELNLTKNPEYRPDDDQKQGVSDEKPCSYICPITRLEMSGKFRFVAFWTCGCVISERAYKAINDNVCAQCQEEFTEDDVVILNAQGDEVRLMLQRKFNREDAAKTKKKTKNVKVKTEIVSGDEFIEAMERANQLDDSGKVDKAMDELARLIEGKPTGAETPPPPQPKKYCETSIIDKSSTQEFSIDEYMRKRKLSDNSTAGPSNAAKTARKNNSSVTDVTDRKNGGSSTVAVEKAGPSRVAKKTSAPRKSSVPKTTKKPQTVSVAADPHKSDVYKSLFTSHKSEQLQARAHWRISFSRDKKCQKEFTKDDVFSNAKGDDINLMFDRMHHREYAAAKTKNKSNRIDVKQVVVLSEDEFIEAMKRGEYIPDTDKIDKALANLARLLEGKPTGTAAPPPSQRKKYCETSIIVKSSSQEFSIDEYMRKRKLSENSTAGPSNAAKNVRSKTKAVEKAGPSRVAKKTSAPRKSSVPKTTKKPQKPQTVSVAADPRKSDVYKSLYTSQKSEQLQPRARWITHTPFFN